MNSDLRNAILVAGHSILKRYTDFEQDESWHLLDFQVREAPCYVGHSRAGVEAAAADPSALLIYTGGQSRRDAGPRSEAHSYHTIAVENGWWGCREVADRAITEEFARDSFENLLLGICRFREFTGHYPDQVTLVSWEFKRERFDMHRRAICWPGERYTYLGPNNPPHLDQALAAEQRARAKYAADPYSSGPEFRSKRIERNPYRRQHGYRHSCPEVVALLEHEGPAAYAGYVPW